MGTATAPLTGPSRGERVSLTRFIRRAFTLNIGGAPGSIERRSFHRFALVIPIANFMGAIDVFAFLWFVAPLPPIDNIAHARVINGIAFAILMVVTFTICGSLSNKCAEPIANWLNSGEPADDEMVRRVLRFPFNQTMISVVAWIGSALFFAILDGVFSVTLGAQVGIAVLLGGITTCGMLYLLAEKAFHPIMVRALSANAPREPALPGVDARVLLAFGVSTGAPLVALAGLGVAALWDGGVPADKLALTAVVLGGAALTSGLLAMKLVARSFASALRSMREALARVERGDFTTDVRIHDGSEIGVVQAGFNSMVAGLREREKLRDLFGKHVGQHVANSALERGGLLGGEQRDAAVLFVDLIGSTALASEREPDEVLGLLNRYFGIVVDVAHKHDGWVNKFEGDGALCIFGAPGDMDDPAGCALSAAREMDERLRAELPQVAAAIGVSAGRVVAGNVGHRDRFEYTVIGDPVNEAARLTQLAKDTPGRVLASACTLDRVVTREQWRWRNDGQATLRGRQEATQLVVPVAAT
ncbi:MAG: adenylate cyclase [Thermoleophilaceae bacterium]|jgi:adenylate cyclase|nr:adenylate cyclase [Thermoleophilaceae bacterium]